jgi:TonB family protein
MVNGSVVSLLMLGTVACGPGLAKQKPRDPREVARATLVAASADPAALAKLMRGSVVNGGLWFDDPACSAQFPIGRVEEAQFGAFAQCLAALKMTASLRSDSYPDVTVMNYGPGFEIEARIVEEKRGPRLTWIGFASRRDDADNAPTITSAALEQLRLTGEKQGAVEASLQTQLELEWTSSKLGQYAWLKLCLDDKGTPTEVATFAATSQAAHDAFKTTVQGWTFKPFTRLGRPVPVCSMVRMVYPATEAATPETLPLPLPRTEDGAALNLPPRLLESRRIAGDKLVVPDNNTKDAIMESGVGSVIGSFKLCLDEAGAVASVTTLRPTGFEAYDRTIHAAMKKWRYQPATTKICTAVTFIYSQR